MTHWLKKLSAPLTVLILALSLSACGFRLLGTNTNQSMPSSVAVIGNTDNEIVDALKLQKPANIVATSRETADLILEVGEVTTGRSVLSKTASGTVSEYRVSLSVIVQVYDKNKNQLLAPTRLTTSRNLIVGTGYATAQDAEFERLNTDMANELASSIVYRMRAIWFAHQKAAS